MSNILSKFNVQNNSDLPIVKLGSLEQDKEYEILDVNIITNRFGDSSVLATINHNNEKCKTFLPQRIAKQDVKDILQLKGYKFIYRGMKQGNAYMYHDIHFL